MKRCSVLVSVCCISLFLAGCHHGQEPAPLPDELACGGIADIACPEDQYCDYEPDQCDMPDAMGVCMPRPEICTEELAPVCACDGRSYGNACEAARMGVSVLHEGRCEPIRCGGIAAVECPEDLVCVDDPDDDCDPDDGGADCSGICVPE